MKFKAQKTPLRKTAYSQHKMRKSPFSLNQLGRVLAPIMNQFISNESVKHMFVGLVQKIDDLDRRELLIGKQITDRQLSFLSRRPQRGILGQDERLVRHS
jgi:hypothetical protein